MTQLATFPLRIRFDLDTMTAQTASGGTTFRAWRGNDVTIYVGVFYKGAPLDLSNLASLTLQLKDKQNPTAASLAEVTLAAASLTPIITAGGWTAETEQHGVFNFTAAQMNQDLLGGATRTFWFVLSGLTGAGAAITDGAVLLEMLEDNAGVAGTPPTPPENYYNVTEIDALLALRPPSLALASHAALRAVVTTGGAVAANTLREVYDSTNGIMERWLYVAGTNGDDDANYIRATDYDGAHVWRRVG